MLPSSTWPASAAEPSPPPPSGTTGTPEGVAVVVHVTNAQELLAALEACRGGETLLLAGGDYGTVELDGMWGAFSHGLDFAQTVTLRSAEVERPAVFNSLYLNGASNVALTGLTVAMEIDNGWKEAGFFITASRGIAVVGCDISGGATPGDAGDLGRSGIQTAYCSDLLIANNQIHNASFGTYVREGANIVVRDNRYFDNLGDNSRYGSNLAQVTIENNRFDTVDPTNVMQTHQDHIQFWMVDDALHDTTDVTIRGNTILQTAGDAQSIFMGAENPAFAYRDVLIEDNFIYTAHQHGITLTGARGAAVLRNTLIDNGLPTAGGTPQINVNLSSDVRIAGNIAPGITFRTAGAESERVTLENNLLIQRSDPDGAGYYDSLFYNAFANAATITLEDLMYLPGVGSTIGAAPRHAPSGLTALVTHAPAAGGHEAGFVFSAADSRPAAGGTLDGAQYRWTFSDGRTAEGRTVEHGFADGGMQWATLTIRDATGMVDSFTKTVVRPNAHALSLDLDGSLADATAHATAAAWQGVARYVETAHGPAAYFNGGAAGGDGNYITLARDAELHGASRLTLSLAFQAETDGLSRTQSLFDNHARYGISVSYGQRLNIDIEGTNYFFDIDYADGREHYVAFSFDAGRLSAFFDGALLGTVETGVARLGASAGSPPTIGGLPWSQHVFHGHIRDVELYRRPLTEAQILDLHTPPDEPRVVVGSDGDDRLVGGTGDDSLTGGRGDDWLDGGQGSDVYHVGRDDGVDTYLDSGTQGVDQVKASINYMAIGLRDFGAANGLEEISSGGHDHVVVAGDDAANRLDFATTKLTDIERINGGGGDDVMRGSAGDDAIAGGAGDDRLDGFAGSDRYLVGRDDGYDEIIDGGPAGWDRIEATINHMAIRMRDFGPENGIEEIVGRLPTNIAGDENANRLDFSTTRLTQVYRLVGLGGDDAITGSAASDTLMGGAGNDRLDGGGGSDFYLVDRDEGFDAYVDRGIAGHDLIFAASGHMAIYLEAFSAANGIEEISAGGHTAVNLAGGALDDLLDFSGTTLTGINLIWTDAGDDRIVGSAGADRIDGAGGHDIVVGGGGSDHLTGGAGGDRFVYGAADRGDFIADFTPGDDLIDLSGLDGDTGASGRQALNFSGESLEVVAHGLTWNHVDGRTILQGDVTGDAVADFTVTLNGVVDLQLADFVL